MGVKTWRNLARNAFWDRIIFVVTGPADRPTGSYWWILTVKWIMSLRTTNKSEYQLNSVPNGLYITITALSERTFKSHVRCIHFKVPRLDRTWIFSVSRKWRNFILVQSTTSFCFNHSTHFCFTFILCFSFKP